MMRRDRVWPVVVIVLLLGAAYLFRSRLSGTPATWILWEKSMTTKGGTTTTTWEPLDGFDRLPECHQSAQAIVKSALEFMNSDGRKLIGVRPDGRSAVYSQGEPEDAVDYRLLCFPGPFDPRGNSG
jgi:hypothetical protein